MNSDHVEYIDFDINILQGNPHLLPSEHALAVCVKKNFKMNSGEALEFRYAISFFIFKSKSLKANKAVS